jgi:predicted XRE-type DNA-binding protein
MARRARATKQETRGTRLKLPVSKKPVFVKIGPGLGLGYRRNTTAGTWVVRVADGKGGNWTKAIGAADDFEEADNRTTFDFWQAQERARSVARAAHGDTDRSSKPLTVRQVLDRYKADIATRGGDIGNMTRVKAHIPQSLAQKNVSLLTVRDLRGISQGDLSKVLRGQFRGYSEAKLMRMLTVFDQDVEITTRPHRKAGEAGRIIFTPHAS